MTEFNKTFWKVHPYGQQTILGETEHLKIHAAQNVRVLLYVLCSEQHGCYSLRKFDSKEVVRLIEQKFGKWKAKPVPTYPDYKELPFNGREFHEVRMSPVKIGLLGFRTPEVGHEHNAAIDVINNLLSNTEGSGYIDQLTNESKLLGAQTFSIRYSDYSANAIFFAPKLIGQKLEGG